MSTHKGYRGGSLEDPEASLNDEAKARVRTQTPARSKTLKHGPISDAIEESSFDRGPKATKLVLSNGVYTLADVI